MYIKGDLMIVTYDESLHNIKIKEPTKNRSTTQTFLYSKETGELVAVQCNVCGEIKSFDDFRKPDKNGVMNKYQCRECEKSRKKEHGGYNTGKIYIYMVTFFNNSIYVGQTKGLQARVTTHISDLKRGNHCDEILKYYNEHPDETVECFKNYKVIKTFDVNTSKDIVDKYEYELQIEYHKKGYKVLGRQSVDIRFLKYLLDTNRITNIFDCIV